MAFCLGLVFSPIANYFTPKTAAVIDTAHPNENTRLLGEEAGTSRSRDDVNSRHLRHHIVVPRSGSSTECWGGVWNAYDETYPCELQGYVCMRISGFRFVWLCVAWMTKTAWMTDRS